MNNFLKIFCAVIAAIGVVIGALAIVDKLLNKNRIDGDYLDCEIDGEEEEE